jgi:copper(I)-binding protein
MPARSQLTPRYRTAMMVPVRLGAVLLALLLSAGAAATEEARLGSIVVRDAMTRETTPSLTTAAVYLTLVNEGAAADRLIGAMSPLAAAVRIHEHRMTGDGVAVMREVEGGIELAPGASLSFEPGGLHLMLTGLEERLRAGSSLPLTLRFERAGALTLEVPIRSMRGG